MTLQGVLNGIDTALWDPARDPLIAAPFTADQLDGKALCKRYRVPSVLFFQKNGRSCMPSFLFILQLRTVSVSCQQCELAKLHCHLLFV